MLACACPQEEPDQLTDLFAEKISSIEFQQLIFCTDGQFQLPGEKKIIALKLKILAYYYSDKWCPRSRS